MLRKSRGKINSLASIFCYLPGDTVIVELKRKNAFLRVTVNTEGIHKRTG